VLNRRFPAISTELRPLVHRDLHESLAAITIDEQGVLRDARVDMPQSCEQPRNALTEVADVLVIIVLTLLEEPEAFGLGLHGTDNGLFANGLVAQNVDGRNGEPTAFVDGVRDRDPTVAHRRGIDLHLGEIVARVLIHRIDLRLGARDLQRIDRAADEQVHLVLDGALGHGLGAGHRNVPENEPLLHLHDGQHLPRHRFEIAQDLHIVELAECIERLERSL
jgi:hypothetical protein